MTDPGVLGFQEILDRSVRFVRRELRALLPIPLVVQLPVGLVMAVVQLRVQDGLVPGTMPGLDVYGPVFGSFLVSGLVTLLVYLAVYRAIGEHLDGKRPALGEVYRWALAPRRYFTLLLAAFLVLLGMVLLVAPGVVLLLYLGLIVPVIHEEGLAGLAAIGRSFALVRYNPRRRFVRSTALKVFLIYVVTSLVSYAVSVIVQLPVLVVSGLAGFRAATTGRGEMTNPPWFVGMALLSQILSIAVQAVVGLYAATALTLLYRDCRERMEGRALEQAIQRRLAGSARVADSSGSS